MMHEQNDFIKCLYHNQQLQQDQLQQLSLQVQVLQTQLQSQPRSPGAQVSWSTIKTFSCFTNSTGN